MRPSPRRSFGICGHLEILGRPDEPVMAGEPTSHQAALGLAAPDTTQFRRPGSKRGCSRPARTPNEQNSDARAIVPLMMDGRTGNMGRIALVRPPGTPREGGKTISSSAVAIQNLYSAAVISANPPMNVHLDRASTMRAAARHVAHLAAAAISERGRFTWALAGGSTPRELYELLASAEFRSSIDWANVEIFWGDERCVPPTSKDSNFNMAQEALLGRVPVPNSQVHRMAGELQPQHAANQYNDVLRRAFPTAQFPHVPPVLDLILLGMGDDGHTASLFPGSAALEETAQWASAAQKGEQWRLTLTFPVLNAARQVAFLVTGASKQAMLRNVVEGARERTPWPAARVQPKSGALTWFVDCEATAMLSSQVQASVGEK